MTSEEHSAWWTSLSDEEKAIAFVPTGYKYLLLVASLAKRVLAACKMTANERLDLLEKLNGLTDQYFVAEALAAILPMSDTEFQMTSEAMSLDRPGDHLSESFNILTSHKVFGHFLRLNPSLRTALGLMGWNKW